MELPPVLDQYRARMGFAGSDIMARILTLLFNDPDEVTLAAALPGTIEDLAPRTGFTLERTRELVERLFRRGAVASQLHQPDVYKLYPAMIELRDSTVLWPQAPQRIFDLWEELFQNEFGRMIDLIDQVKAPPLMRVVPVERTVAAKNTVLDADSARRVVEEADLIAEIPCACRTHARGVGRGADCPAPPEVGCIQTNAFARALLRRGLGREISRETAIARLAAAEEAGLVHMMRNNVQKDMFICNCCTCCCTALSKLGPDHLHQGVAPSRFRAVVDAELCLACGECVMRCSFNAVGLDDTGVAVVDPARCFGCGSCVLTCPVEALSLTEVRPREHIRVKG